MKLINLNAKQLEAVHHSKGPLLIIAGAGTGKTAVITQKILHLVNEENAKFSEILALTFTEKAAQEMEERVDIAMPYGYDEIWISTFHSFCDKILREEGYHIGLDTNYALLTEAESYILFRRHLFEFELKHYRPLGNPTKFITGILKHFSRLQDEDISPEQYISYAEKMPEKVENDRETKFHTLELAKAYQKFTEIKIKESKIDFGDLIILTLKLFRENKSILDKYHKKFKYILVDEFQDTNYTQNVLVNLLALGKNPKDATLKERTIANLTVVGDDDQSIYKFRGAAISNIMQFNQLYKNADRVVLTENYRSDQEILDAAYQLISYNNPHRLEITEKINKRLISKVDSPKTVQAVKLITKETALEEAEEIAHEILRLTGNTEIIRNLSPIVGERYDTSGQSMFVDVADSNKKYEFSDIAILSRAHNHTEEIAQIFKYYGIPFKYAGAKGLFNRQEVSYLISYLKTLADYTDSISFFNVLTMPNLGLKPREIIELNRTAKSKKISTFEFIEELFGVKVGDEQFVDNNVQVNYRNRLLSEESQIQITTLLTIYSKALEAIKDNRAVSQILYDFIMNSGYIVYLQELSENIAQFKVQNIKKFLEFVQNYEKGDQHASIFDFIDYLKYCNEMGKSPKEDQEILREYNAVNISTVHGSKGLEYPVVFLVNLVSDRFPSRNQKDAIPIPEALINEVITEKDENSSHMMEERRLFYVGATRAKELLYLTAASIYGDGKRKKKFSPFLDELLNRKLNDEELIKPVTGVNSSIGFKLQLQEEDSFISEIGSMPASHKYSYTQLSTYESCPKKYYYGNILSVPTVAKDALTFGSCVHNTLNEFYKLLLRNKEGLFDTADLTEKTLLDIFERQWSSIGYDSKKHEELRKEHGVKVLKDYYKKMFSVDQDPYTLEQYFEYRIGDTLVSGRIDRIDWVDRDKKIVNVIDYKTGEGKTTDPSLIKLQIPIYVMYVEDVLGLKVQHGSLLYVETGKKVELEIGGQEKIDAKEKITEIVQSVQKREFRARPSQLCHYCDFFPICEDALV